VSQTICLGVNLLPDTSRNSPDEFVLCEFIEAAEKTVEGESWSVLARFLSVSYATHKNLKLS